MKEKVIKDYLKIVEYTDGTFGIENNIGEVKSEEARIKMGTLLARSSLYNHDIRDVFSWGEVIRARLEESTYEYDYAYCAEENE